MTPLMLFRVVRLWALCWSTLCFSAQAQQSFFRKVFHKESGSFVEVEALFSILPSSGFAPVRVTISNRTSSPANLSLNCISKYGSEQYYRGSVGKLKTESSFSVAAKGGETQTVDLLVPVSATVVSSSHGSDSGRLEINSVGVVKASGVLDTAGGTDFPKVLLSDVLFTAHGSSLDAAVTSAIGSSSYYRGNVTFSGKFSPKTMPEDWRAYAGYDAVIMQDGDWQEISRGARNAICKWIKMGGHLRVYSASSGTIMEEIRPGSGGLTELQSGNGKVTVEKPPLLPKRLVDDVKKGHAEGFHQAQVLSNDYSSMIWGLQKRMEEKKFDYALFIVVLIVFGIVVGPVNLFVFAKAGMRHKLFFTTPLISLGASILMIGLIFFQDGLGGRGYRVQHIQIEAEGEDFHSYVRQEQFCRTGVQLGNRFEVTESATMTPVPLAESQWARLYNGLRNDQNYKTELTEKGFRSSGDWLQSRSEQAQVLRAVVPSRARIEAKLGDEGYVLQSYFEYEIEEFGFMDQDGKYWKARGIMPGKNFRCEPSTAQEHLAILHKKVFLLGGSAQARVLRLAKQEGSFVAITNKAPMIETFSNVKWMEDTSIITGMVRMVTPSS
jgi:hypothetical protein